MILYHCSECSVTFRCICEPDEVATLRTAEATSECKCPYCDKKLVPYMEHDADETLLKRVVDLSYSEMFPMLMGLGLPAQRDCNLELIKEILNKNTITSIAGTEIDTISGKRSIIHSIKLSNGTALYFGSSSHGAVCYRIRTGGFVDDTDS